jgi:hypothetical protein
MKTQINLTQVQKDAINYYLSLNEKYKNSFFWHGNQNAAGRRRQERNDSFEYKDYVIELSFILSCSCRHFYINKTIYVNGEKRNAATLKNLINN